jgi:aryl-alcohol dehydrogenase-like predicted oxidoreductase
MLAARRCPFEQRCLGAAGVRVSSLALGTMGFGTTGSPVGAIDGDGARLRVALALDAGVTLFDTADTYQDGQSEELLGAPQGRRRDEVLVSTKVHARTGDGPSDVGLSRWHILRACEGSLRRLRTDRIDLYHVHGFDACTPIEETLDALDQLVRDGKVRHPACSNHAAWRLATALGLAERAGLRYASLQAYYSLVARELEWDLLPVGRAAGLGVLVWSPLAGGPLAGKAGATGPPPPNTRRAEVGDLGVGPVDQPVAASVLDALRSVPPGASARPLPYPHWYQRQFTAERFSRDGPRRRRTAIPGRRPRPRRAPNRTVPRLTTRVLAAPARQASRGPAHDWRWTRWSAG